MDLYKRKILPVLLAFLLALALLPSVPAEAAGQIDLTEPVSLTIQYTCDGKAAANAAFSIYLAADVSERAEFTLTEDFSEYPVSLENLDGEGWNALASTLAGYAQRDQLSPLAAGNTDQNGMLTFSTNENGLRPGLYLVIGETYVNGKVSYAAEPFLISLPDEDDTGNTWSYEVTARPKYTAQEEPENGTVSRRVRKVWKDEGSEDSRPSRVTVQLLRDGKVYDTVTLDQEGNWRYTWDDLDADHSWTVVEKELPGYTVRVSREGATFVVTNTRKKNHERPGSGGGSGHSGSSGPSAATKGSKGAALPQTGALWWPVPALLMAGVLLLILGYIRWRSEDEQKEGE